MNPTTVCRLGTAQQKQAFLFLAAGHYLMVSAYPAYYSVVCLIDIANIKMNEVDKKRVQKEVGEYCENRVPDDLKNKIKLSYKIRGNDVNVIESRPHWQDNTIWSEMPIAKIRLNPDKHNWQLYWPRANGKWIKYAELRPCKTLKRILQEIDDDPYCVFWG